jgi:hypothetical protein
MEIVDEIIKIIVVASYVKKHKAKESFASFGKNRFWMQLQSLEIFH